jgi:hypothetical protein
MLPPIPNFRNDIYHINHNTNNAEHVFKLVETLFRNIHHATNHWQLPVYAPTNHMGIHSLGSVYKVCLKNNATERMAQELTKL